MSKLISHIPGGAAESGSHTFNLDDIVRRIDEKQEAARQYAAAVIAQARQAAEAIRDAARQEGDKRGYEAGQLRGLAEGKKAGQQAVMQQLQEVIQPLQKTLESLVTAVEDERRTVRDRATHDVLEFAFRVAEMIVRASVTIDRDTVQRIVADAIGLVLDKSSVEVAVHPDCVELLEAHIPDLKAKFGDLSDFAIVSDDTVDFGGCRVRTPDSDIDARIATQLQELRQQLLHGR